MTKQEPESGQSETLMPCPFCGSRVWMKTKPISFEGITKGFAIECETEGCFGYSSCPYALEITAREAWNRRASCAPKEDAAFRNLVERLAKSGHCNAYEGSFGGMKFVGCEAYRSDDPQEYCLPCEARSLLASETPALEQSAAQGFEGSLTFSERLRLGEVLDAWMETNGVKKCSQGTLAGLMALGYGLKSIPIPATSGDSAPSVQTSRD